MIHAPFTNDQVEALNQYQRGPMHPFTWAHELMAAV